MVASASEIVQQNHTESKISNPGKKWVGAFGSIGTQYHIFSANQYHGYNQNTLGVFLEMESDGWVPLPVKTLRTYRWELRYCVIGGRIEIVADQIPPPKRTGGPYYVDLDHHQIALLGIRRWVLFPDYFLRPCLHLGLGISLLDKNILEDGTRYNFHLIGGGGLEMDLSKRWSIYCDVHWEHYSNGGKMGLTDRDVIGLESVNMVLGFRRALGDRRP